MNICKHCGKEIKRDVIGLWFHILGGRYRCLDFPQQDPQKYAEPNGTGDSNA